MGGAAGSKEGRNAAATRNTASMIQAAQVFSFWCFRHLLHAWWAVPISMRPHSPRRWAAQNKCSYSRKQHCKHHIIGGTSLVTGVLWASEHQKRKSYPGIIQQHETQAFVVIFVFCFVRFSQEHRYYPRGHKVRASGQLWMKCYDSRKKHCEHHRRHNFQSVVFFAERSKKGMLQPQDTMKVLGGAWFCCRCLFVFVVVRTTSAIIHNRTRFDGVG